MTLLHNVPRAVQYIETESRMVDATGWNRDRVSVLQGEFCGWMEMMGAQCEYA
jgi:hypothetical protein